MKGTLVVPADRHPLRKRAVAGRPERAAEPRVGTIGDHDVASAHLLGGPALLVLHHRTAHQAVVEDGRDRFAALTDGCSGGDGTVRDQLVEVAPAHDVAVAREHGMVGPLQLERDAVRAGAQAVVAVEPRERRAKTHLFELVHGSRRQSVAARLLPRVRLALEDDDLVSCSGQPIGRRRSGRATADDHYVVCHPAGLPSLSRGGDVPSVMATSSGSGGRPASTSRS